MLQRGEDRITGYPSSTSGYGELLEYEACVPLWIIWIPEGNGYQT